MDRTIPLVFAALIAAPASLFASEPAPCPQSTVAIYNTSPVLTSAAAMDTVAASGRRVAFDLVGGWIEIVHTGGVGSMYGEAADRYRVTGLDDGTPVSLLAQLVVDGYAETIGCGGTGCWGEFGARIGQAATGVSDSVVARFAAGRFPLQRTLEFRLDVLAGDWFELQSRLWFLRAAGASHHGGGRAEIRFAGLPAGADVVSCQGYQLTVPARGLSWGRLKTIYR